MTPRSTIIWIAAAAISVASAYGAVLCPVLGPPATLVTITGVSPCAGTGTAITCTISGPSILAGTELATFTVTPSGWIGSFAISSATGSLTPTSLVIGGTPPNYTLSVGAADLAAGTGSISGALLP